MLRGGNRRFVEGRTDHPPAKGESLACHGQGQRPYALVITCMDSRVPVERIFDAAAGELFVLRTPANVVTEEVRAGAEYGAERFKVPLIVVLGHTDCTAVEAALKFLQSGTGQLPGGVAGIVRRLWEQLEGSGLPHGDKATATVSHVRLQMNALEAVPALGRRQEGGSLAIIGAVYNVANGTVAFLPEGLPGEDAPE